MDQILTSLRTLLIDHLAATESLTVDLALGGTTVKVPNTSRFRPGDEIYILSASVGFGETSIIDSIPDDKTLIIDPPSVRGWLVSENAYVQKAVNHQFLKGVYIGDLRVIPSFPAIALEPTDEDNEWMTLRSTSHDYKIAIRTYVLADNFETTNRFLTKLTKQIREILIDHIRPIIAGQAHPLTVDLTTGAAVVSVADTSTFVAGDITFVRDAMPRPSQQESYIKTILSPTELELVNPAAFDYLMSRQAEIIRVERLLYDSRPSSITYGFVPGQGGTLLKASQITWFAKEQICRVGNVLT